MKKTPSSSASGSALIYVLVATMLFIALSFVVTNMMRGGGDAKNTELRQVNSSEIIRFADSLRSAAQAVQITGVSESQISFENPTLPAYNYACANGTGHCKLFSSGGGGMAYSPPVDSWLDRAQSAQADYGTWIFTGANEVTNVGTSGGATGADLLAILPWISKDLCLKINESLGVSNPGGNPPKDAGNIDFTKFTGAYTAGAGIGGGDPEIDGKRAGCVEGAGTPPAGSYHFFEVLTAR